MMSPPSGTFAGKVAVVTGASRGIGAATAKALAAEGASVALAARSEDRLRELADEIWVMGGRAIAVPTDVSDADAIRDLVGATVGEFGRLDIAVNNAAGGGEGLGADVRVDGRGERSRSGSCPISSRISSCIPRKFIREVLLEEAASGKPSERGLALDDDLVRAREAPLHAPGSDVPIQLLERWIGRRELRLHLIRHGRPLPEASDEAPLGPSCLPLHDGVAFTTSINLDRRGRRRSHGTSRSRRRSTRPSRSRAGR